jgi:hypothetical protein
LLCPPHLYTSDAVIARNGMNTLSDYCNVDELRTLINEPQYWPEQFYRRERESFVTWCSRMAYEFRAPTYWAALNEIKNSYVEIMNPLLSSRIVECFFRLPDKLRHHNRLYWDIVRTMSPDIPFAENVAIENINSILRRPSLVAHLFETLDTNEARYLLTDELVDFVLRNMKMNHGTRAIPKRIIPPALKGVAPPRLRKFIHRAITPNVLDPNVLAFRAYIIHKMNSILSQDAQAFKTDSDAESMNLDEKHFVA